MAKITFTTESAAEPLLVVTQNGVNTTLDLRPAGAEKRTATHEVAAGTSALLTWIFGGNPGTKYKITLDPKAKITLSRGKNPIESSISTQRFFGQGSVMFEVAP
ncbi:MAG: hypothetical protein KDD47_16740 [Acidobacteria bacterium]|nr:hypothetical protein [Acidobacteriota bacterium]